MGGDRADLVFPQELCDTLLDDSSSRGWSDWLDFFSGSLIMPGKDREGREWSSGISIQTGPLQQIILYCLYGACGKTDDGLFVAFPYDNGSLFVPINIATPQFAYFMNTETCICQG
jgi:hypothetical protein